MKPCSRWLVHSHETCLRPGQLLFCAPDFLSKRGRRAFNDRVTTLHSDYFTLWLIFLASVANLIQVVPETLWLVLDGVLIDEDDLILDPVIEGRIQAYEASLHIGDPGEPGLEHVEEEDLV